jgi:hypothetical protein
MPLNRNRAFGDKPLSANPPHVVHGLRSDPYQRVDARMAFGCLDRQLARAL